MNKDMSINSSSISLDEITEAVADVIYKKRFSEIVTFKEVAEYALEKKKKNSEIAAFVISVKKNYDPQNDNDKYIIIQGLLDKSNRPISLNGKESESRIIHTRTIDKQFLDVLNGSETRIIRI